MFANIAHAESIWKKGMEMNKKMYGFPNDESLWEQISNFITRIEKIIDWFSHFPEHVYKFTADIFAWIFKVLMLIGFQTPTFIFNNSYTQHTSLLFSSISVMVIIVFTIFESFMQMFSKVSKKKYTSFYTILKRLPIALGTSLSLPFIFEIAFKTLNKLTKNIANMGGNLFKGDNFSDLLTLSGVDVLGMIVFDVICIGLMVPVLINSGRRFWQIFLHLSISPLAFSAWIFDRHRHLHKKWWNNVKDLSLVQLVYAVFILLLGTFLYAVRFVSADMMIFKILIIMGALHSLANPPSFITKFDRTGRNEIGLFDSYVKLYKNFRKVTSLKEAASLKYYRSQKVLNSKRSELRSKHGKRFVDDLLPKNLK